MIELCIDIAGHIISDRRLRVPVSYAKEEVIGEYPYVPLTLCRSLFMMHKN